LVHPIEQSREELKNIDKDSLNADTAYLLDIFFEESIKFKPKLIVELGIKRGISTIAFSKVAKIFDSVLIGVDKNDCRKSCSYEKWKFIQSKSMDFGRVFKRWCRIHKINPEIDILFIDTSHIYDHTKEELNIWIPFMNKSCKVFIHDTNPITQENIKEYGVKEALEEFIDYKFDSTQNFTVYTKEWKFEHISDYGGLARLSRGDI